MGSSDSLREPPATDEAPRWREVARRFGWLAVAQLLVGLAFNERVLSPTALAILPGAHRLSPTLQFRAIAATLSAASLVQLVVRVGVVTLLLQFVLATLGVECSLCIAADAVVTAGWAIVAESAARLLFVWHAGASTGAITVVPWSLAYFVHATDATGPALSPVRSLQNLVNPFELAWCVLLVVRLRTFRKDVESPLLTGGATWGLATLPMWLVSSILLKLLRP